MSIVSEYYNCSINRPIFGICGIAVFSSMVLATLSQKNFSELWFNLPVFAAVYHLASAFGKRVSRLDKRNKSVRRFVKHHTKSDIFQIVFGKTAKLSVLIEGVKFSDQLYSVSFRQLDVCVLKTFLFKFFLKGY